MSDESGWELLLDGQIAVSPTAPGLRRILGLLVEATGLTAISDYFTHVADGQFYGRVIIAESHIVISGVAKRRCHVDVFSCRAFPTEEVKAIVEKAFGGQWTEQFLERGKDHASSREEKGEEGTEVVAR